jgi:hypothetical protein
LNGALKGHPKPARSFQRSCEALQGWFERPCGAFKGEDGRSESPSNGRLEPLNTRCGGVQKAPLSFEIRVFPLWGPRAPDEPRKGKGRASRFIWGRGPKEASKRGGAPFKGSGRRLNGLGGGGRPDLWSLVRACTGMHAPARSSLHGGCAAMYGACTGTHALPCTAVHAGGVKGRLRGPRGGKGGGVWQHFEASGCVPAHVRACTEVYGGARPCTGVHAGARSGRS